MSLRKWLGFGPSRKERMDSAMKEYEDRLKYLYFDAILKDGKPSAWVKYEVEKAKGIFMMGYR